MAESDDAQLELKKRARRRLVGATALALLAAIVLPMVMEHEPRPPAQDIQVRIPSQDGGGFSSRILPTKPAPTPLPPVAAAVEAKPTVDAVPESKPAPIAAASAVEKPQEKPTPKAAEQKPAEQKAAEQKTEAPHATADQWVVQLGAYKEIANVKLRIAKLKELGVSTYTEKIDTPQGPRIRVRAGPYPSKEAAEKARVRIKIVGIDGPVAPK